jgi:hypothetical protein
VWDSRSELRSSLCERRLERTVLRPVKTAHFTQFFPSGMTSHSKIAQFNWECIAPLRRVSATARLLGFGFESRRGYGCLSVCECCELSGTGLCVGLITRPEESYYGVWCVWVSSWILYKEEALAQWGGSCAKVKKSVNFTVHPHLVTSLRIRPVPPPTTACHFTASY